MLIKYYSTQRKKKFYHPNPKARKKARKCSGICQLLAALRPAFLHILCREGDETMPTNGLRYLRRVAALLAAGGVLAAGLLFALRAELPDTFVLEQGQPLAVESMPFLQAAPAVPAGSAAPAGVTAADKSANVTLTLLGLPVKTVRTVQQQRRTVRLGGTPFGVKMFTDGALVVAFSDIYTVHGSENPAKEAGLRLGDLITQQQASRCAPMRN